jgi:hypothetical protein
MSATTPNLRVSYRTRSFSDDTLPRDVSKNIKIKQSLILARKIEVNFHVAWFKVGLCGHFRDGHFIPAEEVSAVHLIGGVNVSLYARTLCGYVMYDRVSGY